MTNRVAHLVSKWRAGLTTAMGLLLVVVVAASCTGGSGVQSSTTGPEPPASTSVPVTTSLVGDRHADGLARWARIGAEDFVVAFDVSCEGECGLHELRHEMTVRSSERVQAWTIDAGSESRSGLEPRRLKALPANVDAFFEWAAGDDDAIYDPATGVPVIVHNGNVTYRSISVTFDIDAAIGELAAAQARWDAISATDYTLRYRRSCFCIGSGDYVIEVTDAGPIAVDVPDWFAAEDELPDWLPLTVEDLFELIGGQLNNSVHGFGFSYNPDGYPTSITVDREYGVADDEFRYGNITVIPIR